MGALVCIGLILGNLAPVAAAPQAAPLPDLQINKVGPNSIPVGEPFTYTLNITNNSAGTLNGVVITDTWTAQDYDGSYTATGAVNVLSTVFVTQPIRYMQFNLAPLSAGAIGSLNMGMVISTIYQPNFNLAPLVVGNNALITTSTPGKTSNNDSVNTIVVGPVLTFVPSITPPAVRPGRLITFSFAIENHNRSDAIDANNVVFTTTVPGFAEIYTLNPPAEATLLADGANVVWHIPAVPVSTTARVTITAHVFPTITFGTQVYYSYYCSGIADTLINPIQCANLDTTLIENVFEKPVETVSPPVPNGPVPLTFPNRVVSYTVYAYNPFTFTAALRITDTLPRFAGDASYAFQYIGMSSSNTNPPTNVTTLPGGIVAWTTPPINGWGVYSFTFLSFLPPTMPIPANQSYYEFYNILNGSYGDIILPQFFGGGQAIWIVREVPQILIDKIVTPTTQIVGLPVTYTVVLSNSGPTIVRNISITDVLPSNAVCGFTYNGALPGPAPSSMGTGFAAWTNITITAYSRWTATFSALAFGQPFVSCSNSVYGFSTDSFIVEHDFLSPVLLDEPFKFSKTVNPQSVVLGGQIQYTAKEQNTGGENAVMNGFTDTLPSGFLYGSSPVYTNSVGVPFTLLANSGSTYQTTFAVTVASAPVPCNQLPYIIPQTYGTFGMRITSPPRLAGLWYNADIAAPLNVLPQIATSNVASPSGAVAHDVVTFTIVLSNNTAVQYNQLRVTDTLPSGAVFGGPLPGTAVPSVNGSQVVWTNQSVPANGGRTLAFTATVGVVAPGNYVNVASVTSDLNPAICAPLSSSALQVGLPLVTVIKTPSQSTAGPLSKFTYDIAFYNLAPVAVTIGRFTDTLPGLAARWRYDSMLSPSEPQPISTNPPVWQNLVVPAGSQLHMHVNVRTGTEFGTYTNLMLTSPSPAGAGQFTGTIKAGWVLTADGSFNGAPVTVVPGVGLDKVVSPGPVANGDSVVYTITVVNLSGAAIDSVVVTDTLAAGFSYETPVSGIVPTTTVPLVWNVGTVLNGDSNKFVFSFRARIGISEPTGIYYNRVIASSPSINIPPTDDIAPVQVISNIGPHPDMLLSKSDGRPVAATADFLTYTLYYTNAGDAPASGILLTETLPANSSFVAGPAWSAIAGGQFTATVADLAIGQSGSLTLSVQITGSALNGFFTNTARIGALDEVNRSNNTAVDVDALQRLDVRVTVDDRATNVRAAQILTYVVGYTNTGNDLVSGVILTETLSPGLNYVASGWSAVGGGVFTRSVGNLASGGAGSANLIVQVDPAIAGGSSVTNAAQVGFSGLDANPADNTATDIDFVSPPDLYLFQDDGVAVVAANQLLTYTFYYQNLGGTAASGVVITDVLPVPVTLQDSSGWTLNGGTYSFVVGSLAPNSSGVVRLVARVNPGTAVGTLLTSTARIVGGADANPANNESDDVDIVQTSGPDLLITGVQPGFPAIGITDTIIVTVTNAGTAGTSTWFSTDLYIDRVPLNRTDLGNTYDVKSVAVIRHAPSRVADLLPGQSVQFVYQLQFNDFTTHQLYFQADTCDTTGGVPNGFCPDASYGRIAETNEANNIYGPVSVTAVVPHTVYLPIIRK